MPLEIDKAKDFRISEKKVFGARSGDYISDGQLLQFFIDNPNYYSIDEITDMLGVKSSTAKDRVNPFTGERTIWFTDDDGVTELDIPKLLARRINQGKHYYAFINHDPDEEFIKDHVNMDDMPDLIEILNKSRLSKAQVDKLKAEQEDAANDPMNEPRADGNDSDEPAPGSKKRAKSASRKK